MSRMSPSTTNHLPLRRNGLAVPHDHGLTILHWRVTAIVTTIVAFCTTMGVGVGAAIDITLPNGLGWLADPHYDSHWRRADVKSYDFANRFGTVDVTHRRHACWVGMFETYGWRGAKIVAVVPGGGELWVPITAAVATRTQVAAAVWDTGDPIITGAIVNDFLQGRLDRLETSLGTYTHSSTAWNRKQIWHFSPRPPMITGSGGSWVADAVTPGRRHYMVLAGDRLSIILDYVDWFERRLAISASTRACVLAQVGGNITEYYLSLDLGKATMAEIRTRCRLDIAAMPIFSWIRGHLEVSRNGGELTNDVIYIDGGGRDRTGANHASNALGAAAVAALALRGVISATRRGGKQRRPTHKRLARERTGGSDSSDPPSRTEETRLAVNATAPCRGGYAPACGLIGPGKGHGVVTNCLESNSAGRLESRPSHGVGGSRIPLQYEYDSIDDLMPICDRQTWDDIDFSGSARGSAQDNETHGVGGSVHGILSPQNATAHRREKQPEVQAEVGRMSRYQSNSKLTLQDVRAHNNTRAHDIEGGRNTGVVTAGDGETGGREDSGVTDGLVNMQARQPSRAARAPVCHKTMLHKLDRHPPPGYLNCAGGRHEGMEIKNISIDTDLLALIPDDMCEGGSRGHRSDGAVAYCSPFKPRRHWLETVSPILRPDFIKYGAEEIGSGVASYKHSTAEKAASTDGAVGGPGEPVHAQRIGGCASRDGEPRQAAHVLPSPTAVVSANKRDGPGGDLVAPGAGVDVGGSDSKVSRQGKRVKAHSHVLVSGRGVCVPSAPRRTQHEHPLPRNRHMGRQTTTEAPATTVTPGVALEQHTVMPTALVAHRARIVARMRKRASTAGRLVAAQGGGRAPSRDRLSTQQLTCSRQKRSTDTAQCILKTHQWMRRHCEKHQPATGWVRADGTWTGCPRGTISDVVGPTCNVLS